MILYICQSCTTESTWCLLKYLCVCDVCSMWRAHIMYCPYPADSRYAQTSIVLCIQECSTSKNSCTAV